MRKRGAHRPGAPGRASLELPFMGDLHVAKPKRVSRALVNLKVSSLALAGECASVHPSPLLGFCEGLLAPHHLSAGASTQHYTLLCLRSHDTGLRTFSWLVRSPLGNLDHLYTPPHISCLSSGPSIRLPALTSSFYLSRALRTHMSRIPDLLLPDLGCFGDNILLVSEN